jgi:citrate lyase beta subunit
MSNPYRVRRVQLYIPGDDLHKIEKGAGLGVDSLILDIEDGVALARKDAARETIAKALRTLDFGNTERLVRINPVDSGLEEDDLPAALAMRPDGIVIPKVERPEHVMWVSEQIRLVERKNNWPVGGIRILVLIETARGVINLKEIAGCDERLDALIFGEYDLAGSLGSTITTEGYESLYARSAIVMHAVAFGLQAIDSVNIDLNDMDSLVRQATQAMYMGFTGKQAIHPRQVEPIAAVFTPTDEAISAAQRLVDAYQEHQDQGRGVFALDGKMIDMPLIRAAENVLVRARVTGKL